MGGSKKIRKILNTLNRWGDLYVGCVTVYSLRVQIWSNSENAWAARKNSLSLEIFGITEWTYVRVGWRGDIEGIDLTEIETTTETKKIILTGNFFEFEENTIKIISRKSFLIGEITAIVQKYIYNLPS